MRIRIEKGKHRRKLRAAYRRKYKFKEKHNFDKSNFLTGLEWKENGRSAEGTQNIVLS